MKILSFRICCAEIVPDVKILNRLAGTVDKHISKSRTYNLPAMAKEFERSIFKELNYMEEVKNIKKITNNFKEVDYIKIPEVYPEHCSSKLITMELIDGYELPDLYGKEVEGINNAEIAQYGCQSYLKQVLIDGFFHADPHPGNLFVTRDNRLCYIGERRVEVKLRSIDTASFGRKFPPPD